MPPFSSGTRRRFRALGFSSRHLAIGRGARRSVKARNGPVIDSLWKADSRAVILGRKPPTTPQLLALRGVPRQQAMKEVLKQLRRGGMSNAVARTVLSRRMINEYDATRLEMPRRRHNGRL